MNVFREMVAKAVRAAITKVFAFQNGTIPDTYTSGRPTVLFDGETTASSRTYTYLASYTPTAGDRVLFAKVGTGGVVLGKIV